MFSPPIIGPSLQDEMLYQSVFGDAVLDLVIGQGVKWMGSTSHLEIEAYMNKQAALQYSTLYRVWTD